MAGMVTIPLGCIAGGAVAMVSGVTVDGQPVDFSLSMILINMIPVIAVAVLLAIGLKLCRRK